MVMHVGVIALKENELVRRHLRKVIPAVRRIVVNNPTIMRDAEASIARVEKINIRNGMRRRRTPMGNPAEAAREPAKFE